MNSKILKLDTYETDSKRKYTTEEIQKAIDNTKFPILCELTTPESPIVNIENVSHKVTDMYIEDGYLIADIEVLNTPKGTILKNLINSGLQFKVSGYGKVDEDNVVSGYSCRSVSLVND